jgi:O-antigen ligase
MFAWPSVKGISLFGGLLTILLALGWLLPNHYPPWNTFHTDAWVAGILAATGLWALCKARQFAEISTPAMLLFGVALIPWAHFLVGAVQLPGSALMGCLYVLGLAAGLVVGQYWARSNPGQPATFVLVAALLASVVSVGIQLYQWLGLAQEPGVEDIWIFPFTRINRPYANLAQPNQLASLLLWGLLGVAWIRQKKWIGNACAFLLAGFILFGIALTESRTALLSLCVAIAGLSAWRPAFLGKGLRYVQALFVYYLACLASLAPLSHWLGRDATLSLFERSAGEARLAIWQAGLEASRLKPWFGYGWDQTTDAFLSVYSEDSPIGEIYVAHSHSLPLDLVLWLGWPLALLLLAFCAVWALRLVRSATTMPQLLTVAALSVMMIHALLELPLHHGYFLWPFGLLAGSAMAASGFPPRFTLPRGALLAALATVFVSGGIVIRDYMKVEDSFYELRFQLSRIGTGHDETPADTWLLHEWPAFMAMTRAQPRPGMSATEIEEWKNLLLFHTSPVAFRQVALALAQNGRMDEARLWSTRACSVMPKQACRTLIADWTASVQQPAQPRSAISQQ